MVVVTTSGGGIQSSLWAAKVLAELQRELGQRFTKGDVDLAAVVCGIGRVYDDF